MTRLIKTLIIIAILFLSCKSSYQPVIVETKKAVYPLKGVTEKIEAIISNPSYNISYNELNISQNVKDVYSRNLYLPYWGNDSLKAQSIALISRTKAHGLNPNHYNKLIIDSLTSISLSDSIKNLQRLALLDISITNAVLSFTEHLSKGKLNPEDYHAAWNYPIRENACSDTSLYSLIKSGRILKLEKICQPKTISYTTLMKELLAFQQLKTENYKYGEIKYPGMLLRNGDSNIHVSQLKQELIKKGYFTEDSLSFLFTSELESAIKTFQKKHGLNADGLPGKKTYEFLNWSVEKYINTLSVNLERLRWLPDSTPNTYIDINIPAYQLELYANKQLKYTSKVIVGKYKNQTPVFESNINYLVFNPCWTIPNSIASKKILPRLKKDSSYLDNRNMFISLNGEIQEHDSIDFSAFSEYNFPYKIFQRTGAGNALGKVKFMFPNKYSIYLHDTPGKSLFARDQRAFSHGCVRVQNAVNLSQIILHEIDRNTKPLSYYFDKGFPEKVYLKMEIALHLHYLTCNYNSEDNQVQFFKDVYILDYKLLTDLKAEE